MKFPKYYVDDCGIIHTLFSENHCTVDVFGIEYIIDNTEPYLQIVYGEWEDDYPNPTFRYDQEFVLWDSLIELAKTIKEK